MANILTIPKIQGTGFGSPYAGVHVDTRGVVVGMEKNGFHLQDPVGDGNPKTPKGIFVETTGEPTVTVGDKVRVVGTVVVQAPKRKVFGRPGELEDDPNALKRSCIKAESIAVTGHTDRLPKAVRIGTGRRARKIDGSDSARARDDLYSLQSTRVFVRNPRVVAGSTPWGIAVVPDGGKGSAIGRKGHMRASAEHPQADVIELRTKGVEASLGDRLSQRGGPVFGVLTLRGAADFQITPEAPISVRSAGLKPQITKLKGDEDHFTIATLNVHNLDPKVESEGEVDDDVGAGLYAELGKQIAVYLAGPDALCVQEMQDDNGAELGTEVSAEKNFEMLIEAIVAAGGPRYVALSLPPGVDLDGGQPGGNIRVGILYNPERVKRVPDSVRRLFEDEPAFLNTRKPLTATLVFNGREIDVVGFHNTAQSGSAPLFGMVQPPTVLGEPAREAQGKLINGYLEASLGSGRSCIALGDGNENPEARGIVAMAGKAMKNLAEPDEVSYIYKGRGQKIDQIMADHNLAAGAEHEVLMLNAEFPATAVPGTDVPKRHRASGDHNPAIARFYIPRPE